MAPRSAHDDLSAPRRQGAAAHHKLRFVKASVDVATNVAEAATEVGFLGGEGTRVSADEKRAIDQIKSVAGLSVV
jgi:tellurite resistance protein